MQPWLSERNRKVENVRDENGLSREGSREELEKPAGQRVKP